MGICTCYPADKNFLGEIGVCWGTKEMEACSCRGNEADCDFYPDKRQKKARIKFVLDGCDISFTAEAPPDITLQQLLKQADRIVPNWCACGIRSKKDMDLSGTEIFFDYDDVWKASEDVECTILKKGD